MPSRNEDGQQNEQQGAAVMPLVDRVTKIAKQAKTGKSKSHFRKLAVFTICTVATADCRPLGKHMESQLGDTRTCVGWTLVGTTERPQTEKDCTWTCVGWAPVGTTERSQKKQNRDDHTCSGTDETTKEITQSRQKDNTCPDKSFRQHGLCDEQRHANVVEMQVCMKRDVHERGQSESTLLSASLHLALLIMCLIVLSASTDYFCIRSRNEDGQQNEQQSATDMLPLDGAKKSQASEKGFR